MHCMHVLIRCIGSDEPGVASTVFFFINHTATPEIYTLSLHDALPISAASRSAARPCSVRSAPSPSRGAPWWKNTARSEEHTSELQSHSDLVCRLLLEKKKKMKNDIQSTNVQAQTEHPRDITHTDSATI